MPISRKSFKEQQRVISWLWLPAVNSTWRLKKKLLLTLLTVNFNVCLSKQVTGLTVCLCCIPSLLFSAAKQPTLCFLLTLAHECPLFVKGHAICVFWNVSGTEIISQRGFLHLVLSSILSDHNWTAWSTGGNAPKTHWERIEDAFEIWSLKPHSEVVWASCGHIL